MQDVDCNEEKSPRQLSNHASQSSLIKEIIFFLGRAEDEIQVIFYKQCGRKFSLRYSSNLGSVDHDSARHFIILLQSIISILPVQVLDISILILVREKQEECRYNIFVLLLGRHQWLKYKKKSAIQKGLTVCLILEIFSNVSLIIFIAIFFHLFSHCGRYFFQHLYILSGREQNTSSLQKSLVLEKRVMGENPSLIIWKILKQEKKMGKKIGGNHFSFAQN